MRHAVLARTWIPALGEVRVDALGGTGLRVAVLGDVVRSADLVLGDLASGARVRAAAASDWSGDGLALALAIEQGEATTYHVLIRTPFEENQELVTLVPGARNGGWWLSPALFESTGEPYRIADVHCPGTDALEITFRRGWPKGIRRSGPVEVDEKLYFDACPGAPAAAVLLDVAKVLRTR